MSAERAVELGKGGTITMLPKPNVHQRKLAVMKRCDELKPDKTHPAHHFPYISIQRVSNELRKFAIEEGLDIIASVDDGQMVIQLVNVDSPEIVMETITSRWPLVDGDKAWSYSFKWALMRLFLIGDGEEGDEAEMADRSGVSTGRRVQNPSPDFSPGASSPSPSRAGAKHTPTGRGCPECGDGSLELVQLASGARWVGCTNWNAAVPCKYREKAPAYVPTTPSEAERQTENA